MQQPTNETLFQVCKFQVSESMPEATEEQLNACASLRYESLYKRVCGEDSQPWEDDETKAQREFDNELTAFFKTKGEPWNKIF